MTRIRITNKINSVIKRDKRVMLTTTREPFPFVAARGDGDYAYDISGNRFIDFASFISVYNMGINGNSEIRTAIKKQVDKLMHPAFTDYYSEPPVAFVEDLLKMFPTGFGRAFLSNSGTEANEAAIKFAKLFTKRQYIVSFYNSFHGRTLGSLGMTASKVIHRERFGPFAGVVHTPYPYPYRCPFNHEKNECGMDYIDYLEDNVFGKEVAPEEVAAIFIEPIQGEGGYIVPPKKFMTELRKIADENGILLIADEVQSGYMRTGKFLALDNFGIKADIYTMAKSVGGGLPMGVTVTRSSLGDIPSGSHANTFGGNLVAVAAAHASLKYLMRNLKSIRNNIEARSTYIFKRLREMQESYESIGDVRGMGLMIGAELVENRHSKKPAIKEREEILRRAFMNGLLMLPAGKSTIRIIPPLTVSSEAVENGMDVLEECIKAVLH